MEAEKEIEITPDAVEAGVEAYLEWLDRDGLLHSPGRLESLVRQILSAALPLMRTQRTPPKTSQ